MISAKEATKKAFDYSKEYFEDSLNPRLEELWFNEHSKYYSITLSFEVKEFKTAKEKKYYSDSPTPPTPPTPLDLFDPDKFHQYNRLFRVFKINAEDGSLISIAHSHVEA